MTSMMKWARWGLWSTLALTAGCPRPSSDGPDRDATTSRVAVASALKIYPPKIPMDIPLPPGASEPPYAGSTNYADVQHAWKAATAHFNAEEFERAAAYYQQAVDLASRESADRDPTYLSSVRGTAYFAIVISYRLADQDDLARAYLIQRRTDFPDDRVAIEKALKAVP